MSESMRQHGAVAHQRARRGWSQAELARRAGLPRTTVGAIEGARLTPSVTAAMALAHALECSVEELFGAGTPVVSPRPVEWAWAPRSGVSRYWEAEVAGRRWLYPVEASAGIAHDGTWLNGTPQRGDDDLAEATLVLACCDPAASLLASEYASASGFRLLVFCRGGAAALDLLKRGRVHLAGMHRATTEEPGLNAETVRSELGSGYRLLRAASWQEGVALPPDDRTRTAAGVLRRDHRWALREPGSAARECLDALSGGRHMSGRVVAGHDAVGQAIRAGWADAGVCVRLVAEEFGLAFLPVRIELLDFCFADAQARDPRVQALVRLLRSRAHRRLISELPGYEARDTGEVAHA